MSWITLTVTDLRNRLSPREADAIARAIGAFDDAAAQAAIDDAADTARGYIRANARNRVAAEPHSVPRALKADVLAVALVDYCSSVAGMLPDPKGIRKAAYDRAVKRWEDAASGKFAVEQPAEGETEDGQSAASPAPPSTYSKDILASRQKQQGVL